MLLLGEPFPSCIYHRWCLFIYQIQLSRGWNQLGIPR